ncbi:hypothetical protein [Phyllobacterium sp. OV277]|uniref:hypothetical protein n=1 Tax=Phyllobacterium sp. OV277 TaxID=1882772 RepID=UPI00088A298F|nr:hypothetical protein [Phyllobacterium sp. OV277]SDO57057.1 hypothetical protein SAMN05443582_102525 [Phyllobacterium sp. OV277]
MAKLVPFWQSHPIEYLLRARFPTAQLEDTAFPSRFTDDGISSSESQKNVQHYKDELEALSPNELNQLILKTRTRYEEIAKEKANKEEQARSFNQHHAKANFEHWAKMAYWSIDEAVALSLGRDPNYASWKHIQSLTSISPFAAQFSAKREIAIRAKTMGQLWEQTIPSNFLAWAERMGFEFPTELVDSIQVLGIQIADWKTLYDGQKKLNEAMQNQLVEKHDSHMSSLHEHSAYIAKTREEQSRLIERYKDLMAIKDDTIADREEHVQRLMARIAEIETGHGQSKEKSLSIRERESLLKLIIGMAIKKYHFKPMMAKNAATSNIASDLRQLDMSLDEDTIRKYLSEAKVLLRGGEL